MGCGPGRLRGPARGRAHPLRRRLVRATSAGSGDLDEDGVRDVVIASPAAANGEGEVIAVSGDDGTPVWDGVLRPADPNSNATDTATHLGTALAVFSDVSGCAQQLAGDNCLSPTSPDGVPELLVGAPGADLNNVSAKEIGRVYVVDGASGAIVKRIQLDPADGLPAGGKVEFGAGVLTVADIDDRGQARHRRGRPGLERQFRLQPRLRDDPGFGVRDLPAGGPDLRVLRRGRDRRGGLAPQRCWADDRQPLRTGRHLGARRYGARALWRSADRHRRRREVLEPDAGGERELSRDPSR